MTTRSGFIALIGRPNVGKSSLLNAILDKKISITSFRPQTTRHQLQGIKTIGNTQYVYVDTPGIHLNSKNALSKFMNKEAISAIHDVDVVVFLVQALKLTEEDLKVAKLLANVKTNIIIAVNKVDLVKDKTELLPFMEELSKLVPKAKIVPISVKKNYQLDELQARISVFLPNGPFYFPVEMISNRNKSFHFSEIVREKLMRILEQELPYSVSVDIEKAEKIKKVYHINALIVVSRAGQKKIVIGKDGAMLKLIGSTARRDLEKFCKSKVCLKLWVKVKENWFDDGSMLKQLGYSANG